MAMLVVGIELGEHRIQIFSNIDINFLREVLLFGITYPLVFGLMLSLIVYTEYQRTRAVNDLEKQKALGQQLSSASQWNELVGYIVRFPSAVVPVISTTLYLYHPGSGMFEMAAVWPSDGNFHQSSNPLLTSEICASCEFVHEPLQNHMISCGHLEDARVCKECSYYCLPIIYHDAPIALMHLELPYSLKITSSQVRLLVSAAHQIALALEGARLQLSATTQAEATEMERRRIAQTLHDTLGQDISYLRLKLDQLTGENALWEISMVKQDLEQMRDIAEDAYQQVRGTLAYLHPSKDKDFQESLLKQARQSGSRAGFRVQYSSTGNPFKLPPNVTRQILLICQEALYNIEKHAQARQVMINLVWGEHDLTIHICDDGKGFDLDLLQDEGHYGLLIMQERVEEIHGKFSVHSSKEAGTEIVIWLPLQPSMEISGATIPNTSIKGTNLETNSTWFRDTGPRSE